MTVPHPAVRRLPAGRRGLATALACVVVTTSLALAPGASAEEESGGSSPSGEQPFGEEIEPGASLQETTVVDTGTYVLQVPAVNEPHFFEIERSEPGENLWYGVTVLLDEPTDDASVTVLGSADGDETRDCNSATNTSYEPRTLITSLYSSNRSAECRDAESVVLTVTNQEGLGDGDPVPEGTWYQLTVWTEPPVESTDGYPGPNENPPYVETDLADAEAQPLEGATTFEDAEPLEDGAYELTIRQNQPAIFAVPLTYGQHAQFVTQVTDGVDTFEDFDSVAWVSPLGGQLRDTLATGGTRASLSLDGEDDPATFATPIVTYTNRQRTGSVGSTEGTRSGFGVRQAAPAAFAGTYFLVLELPGATEFNEFPEEVDVRLEFATVTDYEGAAPDYVTEPTALSALDGSGFVETAEEEQQAREAAVEPPPWGLVAGLFGGAALLAAIGGVAVGRVLRSRS